jgi:hypothetical protein
MTTERPTSARVALKALAAYLDDFYAKADQVKKNFEYSSETYIGDAWKFYGPEGQNKVELLFKALFLIGTKGETRDVFSRAQTDYFSILRYICIIPVPDTYPQNHSNFPN